MNLPVALTLFLAEASLVAALGAAPRTARIGVALAVVLLPWPAFIDAAPLWRCVLALGAAWCVVRALDFLAPAYWRESSFGARLAHVLAIVDTRGLVRGTPCFAWRSLVALIVAASIATAMAWLIVRADGLDGAAHWLLRWLAAAVAAFALLEAVVALAALVASAVGYVPPRVAHAPYRSLSVAEFWADRWNLIVGAVLRERVFAPLRRRGARVAILATFVASALLHAYAIGVALGPWEALAWFAFFALQPLLLAIERRMHVRRWSKPARWAWTFAALGVLAPLFVEPAVRLFEASS